MKQVIARADTEQSVNESTQKKPKILQALLDFIIKQDALTEDPQFQQIKSLSCWKNAPRAPTQPEMWSFLRETNLIKPEILHKPQMAIANEIYVGKNYRFLKVKPGDRVVVHAWIGETEAIGFNEQNDTAGRIPIEHLDFNVQHQQRYEIETFLSGETFRFCQKWDDCLVSSPGDRIRVCSWDGGRRITGTGLNLATGQIGKFSLI